MKHKTASIRRTIIVYARACELATQNSTYNGTQMSCILECERRLNNEGTLNGVTLMSICPGVCPGNGGLKKIEGRLFAKRGYRTLHISSSSRVRYGQFVIHHSCSHPSQDAASSSFLFCDSPEWQTGGRERLTARTCILHRKKMSTVIKCDCILYREVRLGIGMHIPLFSPHRLSGMLCRTQQLLEWFD